MSFARARGKVAEPKTPAPAEAPAEQEQQTEIPGTETGGRFSRVASGAASPEPSQEPAPAETPPADSGGGNRFQQRAGSAPAGQPSPGNVPSFLRRGAEAQKQVEEDRERHETEREMRDGMGRFWLDKPDAAPRGNKKATIVFLDGDLITEGPYKGSLDFVSYKEHRIKTPRASRPFGEFVCPEERGEACPLCNANENPTVVAPFTIIDMRRHVGRNNKVYENERKLFVANPTTLQLLQEMAVKRGGLRGCVFEVTRTGERASRTGDHFDFEFKASREELVKQFGTDYDFSPADYDKEIKYIPPAQILALTGGVAAQAVGSGFGGGASGSLPSDVPF